MASGIDPSGAIVLLATNFGVQLSDFPLTCLMSLFGFILPPGPVAEVSLTCWTESLPKWQHPPEQVTDCFPCGTAVYAAIMFAFTNTPPLQGSLLTEYNFAWYSLLVELLGTGLDRWWACYQWLKNGPSPDEDLGVAPRNQG